LIFVVVVVACTRESGDDEKWAPERVVADETDPMRRWRKHSNKVYGLQRNNWILFIREK
jgi:hypothetical protein